MPPANLLDSFSRSPAHVFVASNAAVSGFSAISPSREMLTPRPAGIIVHFTIAVHVSPAHNRNEELWLQAKTLAAKILEVV